MRLLTLHRRINDESPMGKPVARPNGTQSLTTSLLGLNTRAFQRHEFAPRRELMETRRGMRRALIKRNAPPLPLSLSPFPTVPFPPRRVYADLPHLFSKYSRYPRFRSAVYFFFFFFLSSSRLCTVHWDRAASVDPFSSWHPPESSRDAWPRACHR